MKKKISSDQNKIKIIYFNLFDQFKYEYIYIKTKFNLFITIFVGSVDKGHYDLIKDEIYTLTKLTI